MSRHISSRGGGPHTGVITCSRHKCDVSADLSTELDQTPWNGPDRWTLKGEERTARDALIKEQFRLVYAVPAPEGWISLSEPNIDHPSQSRLTREFCSWRCVRLFAAGREQGKDV